MHTGALINLIYLFIKVSIADILTYSKGLNARQTAFAIQKFKSHRRVGLRSEIIAMMTL
jgi:hypothetical protein